LFDQFLVCHENSSRPEKKFHQTTPDPDSTEKNVNRRDFRFRAASSRGAQLVALDEASS
jgi:hypothetical protein